MPRRLSARTSSTMRSVSASVSPDITSSRSSSRGSVPSARASSSRLRSARVSTPAGSSALAPRPISSSTARARRSASRVSRWRPSVAIITLRTTVSRGNGRMIWNVRARPSALISCGFRPRRSRPAKRTVPLSGARKPEISANAVVLPAPLGPMSATISPSPTVNVRSFTACKPPKRLLRLWISKRSACSRRTVGGLFEEVAGSVMRCFCARGVFGGRDRPPGAGTARRRPAGPRRRSGGRRAGRSGRSRSARPRRAA